MTTQARGHAHERKVNHWLMTAPVRSTSRLHGKRRKPKPLPRRIAM